MSPSRVPPRASTETSTIVDASERDRIVNELGTTLLVEAAAGTGKTTVLVKRMISALKTGRAEVQRMVAVTFTEKAAGELKLRMRSELERARGDLGERVESSPDGPARQQAVEEKQRLERALARLEEAWVGTIHGFCADLLRERSVEAEVDPQFEMLTDDESQRFYREAFGLWLQQQLESPPEGIRRSLRRSTQGDEGPVGRLRQAGWTLVQWRDFPTPWTRHVFHREEQIDALVEALHRHARLSAEPKNRRDAFYTSTERSRRLSEGIEIAERVRDRDYDGLEGALVDLVSDYKWRNCNRGRGQYSEGVSRSDILDAHDRLVESLQIFQEGADADLAALLQHELWETLERYEQLKQRHGRLDFVDLLVRARDLLKSVPQVRDEFRERFSHIYVDEFQDTDPLQAEILLLLAAADSDCNDWRRVSSDRGKLFLVADPKQSIYRFRRADVSVYEEVKQLLLAQGAECLQLTTCFRCDPDIQRLVNHAFAPLMDGDPELQQATYVPLSWQGVAESLALPERDGARPSVVALPVPKPYGYRQVAKYAIEASLPDAVGAYVHWLVDKSGWTVYDREQDQRVPIAARHVCLLFRRFDNFFTGDMTRPYVKALESRGVRHLLVGGRSFHVREEVETLRTALTAVEWPDDELSVFATLHGPLFAITDEDLLLYRFHQGGRRLHPFRVPVEVEQLSQKHRGMARVVAALKLLREFHQQRNRRPIAETISLLLEETRAHAGFALLPSGEQALANVLHVAEQARRYESAGGISFRGFVDQLLEDAQRGQAAEAPILEEGSDGVRIMTVHKAKGLEFPVVVLADMTANLAHKSASRTIDTAREMCAVKVAGWAPAELMEAQQREVARDQAESVRVAYVAATRARELLVVPAVGDLAFDSGWVSPLNSGIYPEDRKAWQRPAAAPGCPKFGQDTVVYRPATVAVPMWPGLHRFAGASSGAAEQSVAAGESDAAYGVVWWDPSQLQLEVPPVFGVRQKDLIGKDAPPEQVQRGVERFEKWQQAHSESVSRGSRPTRRVMTVTEWARRGLALPAVATASGHARRIGQETDVSVVELATEEERSTRPGGARFGALIHACLATVSLAEGDRGLEQVPRIVDLQGRILGATVDERAAAVEWVQRALGCDELAQAARAQARGECRRETPVSMVLSESTATETPSESTQSWWVEGVVDLAYRWNDGWRVIDFKTDRELAVEVYERQLALYVYAIQQATGEPAVGVLMNL